MMGTKMKKPTSSLMCRCSLNIIAKIEKNLNKKNLEIIADSCFGPLLEMNPLLSFQKSLLLLLLQHVDLLSSTNTTLTFNINNSTIKFAAADFESITGLPYGTSKRATKSISSRLHRDVFGSRKTIMLKDVEKAFLDESRVDKGGEQTLKLALLYLLFGVVLPASQSKKLELTYIHLADDLPAFLAFPWGRIGHEFLVSSVKLARDRLQHSRAASINITGFCFALQVWIYEQMPSLATCCAERVRELDGSTPRILGWWSKKRIGYCDLKKFFTLDDDDEELSAEASPGQRNVEVEVEPLTSTDTNTSIPQMEIDSDSESSLHDSDFEERLGNYSRLPKKVSGGSNLKKLIPHCSLEIITRIKENLNKKNLKAFEDSCFGHMLEMKPLCFQGPLLHHLLLSIDTAASSDTLIFNINGSKMEFGPRHFQLITGLRIGTAEAAAAATTAATSSRLHKDVFGQMPAILFKDVEEAFLNVRDKHKGNGEVPLKMALLYFLYGVVLPLNSKKKIDLRYLHLTDNLPVFRAFPWGRVGYEHLVSSMLSARLSLDRAYTLSVPGFTFALQVWAYENIPYLATHCAAREHDLQRSTMRILNWSATTVVRFKELEQFFTLGGDNEEERRSQSEDVVELAPRESDQTIPNASYHELSSDKSSSAEVDDEEAEKETTPARRSRLSRDPASTIKSSSSSAETEPQRAPLALAFDDNSTPHTPQPWKECREFEISQVEYEKSIDFYEALLERKKSLKLWISYAQFKAFAVIQGFGVHDKRKCLKRGRAVIERGLSYFKSCAPKLKKERAALLEEWFDMEYRFGKVGDVGTVRAKLPQKVKKRRRILTEDGSSRYEEYIDYLFP